VRATSQHTLAGGRIFEEIKDSSEGRLVAIDSVKWTWIRAVILRYNEPEALVDAVMFLCNEAYYAKVRYITVMESSEEMLCLAAYLLILLLDYVVRAALSIQI
jgi:hypothetical protein